MTTVSTPRSGALPRQRARNLGSVGAIVFVLVAGAAVALGIAVSSDDAPTPAHPAGRTSTEVSDVRGEPAPVDSADKGYVIAGTELAQRETIERAVARGLIPEKALADSAQPPADRPGHAR